MTEEGQLIQTASPRKRPFKQAFPSPHITIDSILPHFSSVLASVTSYCHHYLEGASKFISQQFSEWRSQQQISNRVERSKKRRKKVVPETSRERRASRRNAKLPRQRSKHEVDNAVMEVPPTQRNVPVSQSISSPHTLDSSSPAENDMHDPKKVLARRSLRSQYARVLQSRDRVTAFQNRLTKATSTSSPMYRGLFASTFDRVNIRASPFGARTAKDAANVLSKITPHKSRVGRLDTSAKSNAMQFPFTTKNLTKYLESPLQQSPLVNYRSPGAPLPPPDPSFNPFRTKENAPTKAKNAEADSLEDLIAQLRREHPHQYEWHKIDKEKAIRNEEIARKRGLLKPARLPVPLETLKKVEKAFQGQISREEVLAQKFNLEIRKDDLSTLKNTAWLNDEVINFYMNLIVERSKSEPKHKIHAFNTFFYTKLSQGGYKDVRRWAKKAKVDISQCDLVLVPIHLGVHWCMAVINAKQKRFEYWDSLKGGAGKVFSALREYMSNEAPSVKIDDWDDCISSAGPQQRNGYDCGVFACQTAECVSRDIPPDFTQEEMPELRKRMAASILDCRLY